jgi:hypothetical protein
VNRLKTRSCLIDGEAVACDENGLTVFERLRLKPSGEHVFLYAFDLLELDGQDLRREPIETRKATLASLLRGSLPGLRLNDHLTHPGDVVFRHACKMGLEGIVSKRLQEPGCACGEARGGGGLGLITSGVLPWRTTSTSHCSGRAWPPGTHGVMRTPTSIRT